VCEAPDSPHYIVEHADGAGNCAVTVFLDDVDAHLASIEARELERDERETYANGVRKAIFRDPDGNELGFAPQRRGQPAPTGRPGPDQPDVGKLSAPWACTGAPPGQRVVTALARV
jgi:hypothetical protein